MSGDLPLSRAGLSQESFRRLLGSLDPDPDRAGEAYERLRRKLIKFFEWRGTRCPEDLADRTIDRVGRKIEEGERIRLEDPTGYFYAVARNVLREHWGDEKHHVAALQLINFDPTTRTPEDVSRAAEEAAETEARLDCLEQCLERLPSESRELITQYYRGQRSVKIENRKALAEGLGIPINALRIRSHRVRVTLETCVRECLRLRRDAKWIRSSATEERESRNDH